MTYGAAFRADRFLRLERRARCAYSVLMDDTPHHGQWADREPPMPREAELLAALAENEGEAGLLVSCDEILRELRESIARMVGRPALVNQATYELARRSTA